MSAGVLLLGVLAFCPNYRYFFSYANKFSLPPRTADTIPGLTVSVIAPFLPFYIRYVNFESSQFIHLICQYAHRITHILVALLYFA